MSFDAVGSFEGVFDVATPFRASRNSIVVGFRKIFRSVLSQNSDQKLSLQEVLARLQCIRTSQSPLAHNQFVDRKAIGSWHLNQDSTAI